MPPLPTTRRRSAVCALALVTLVGAIGPLALAYTPIPLNETAGPVRNEDAPPGPQELRPWVPVFLSAGPVGSLASAALTSIQSETTVGASGTTVVCGFNDFRGSNVSGVIYSSDSGGSVSDGGQLPSPGGTTVYGDPVIAVYTPSVGSPTFYYSSIFVNATAVQTMCVHRSTNGGVSWAGPFEVTPATITGHGADKEWITVDPETGKLFLAWSDFSASVSMKLTTSTDQGATWSAAKTLGSNGQGFVLAADPHNNNVYAAWRSRPATGMTGVAVARSTDNGVNWSSGVTPTPYFYEVVPPYGMDRYNSFPSIVVNPVDYGLEVVYAASVNGTPGSDFGDIFYRRSTDGGVTFTAPVALNVGSGTGRPQFFPSVTAASNGRIDVFWYDESGGGDVSDLTDLMYCHSTDFGATWSSPVPMTPSIFHNETGNSFSAPNQGDYIDAASLTQSWSTFAWTGEPNPFGPGDDAMIAGATGGQVVPARVRPGSIVIADDGCGANDGFLVAGETAQLTIPLENIGRTSLMGATGTLTALTAGVTVSTAVGMYPTIGVGGSAASTAPYVVELASNYPCGTDARFRLDLTATGASANYVEFSLPTGIVTSTTTILSENFDGVVPPALPAGWTLNNGCTGCTTNDWITTAVTPNSPPNAAYVPDALYSSFGRLFGPAVAVPAGTTYLDVYFDFKTDLEQADQRTAFDAFSFEYQVDGVGSSHFATADALEFDNRYTHYVVRASGTQYGDRSGWSGTWPYRTARVRIPGLAGHTFTPRFSLTTDSNTGGTGLWVDNVVIKALGVTCGMCTPTSVADGRDTPAAGTVSLRLTGANPFRGSAVFAYTLARPGSVRLDVFAADGRLVRTLVDGFASEGAHVAGFELRGTSSEPSLGPGVYLARLVTGGATRSLRVVAIQ